MARQKKNPFKKKISKFMQKKLVLLFMGIVLAFVFLVGRITYINASSGEKYTKVVLDQQQYNNRIIPYKRGDIVDRNGTKIATSERVYNVVLDVKVMLSDEDYIEPTIQVLTDCFEIAEEDVRKLMEDKPSSRYSVLKKGVDYDTAQKFEKIEADDKNYPDVKGIWLEEDYVRKYPYNTLASDVIGFTVDGNVGSNGIEASYNSILNGTDGREYGYLDESSTFERTVKEPDNGSTVVSTIDLQVQSIVEKYILAFNEAHKNEASKGEGSKNTAVIVMNPQNGEILAEASYPNYDLNNPRDLSAYYLEEELEQMTDEEKVNALNELWNNFCVSNTYEPGSTFKPFTIAAGLETGVLTGNENYVCGGVMHVGDHDIHCSNRSGHGPETLKQSLENSCNVALMQIGASLGAEEFCRYQKLFGFGEYTGIDLPGEGSTEGLLYTPENMDAASLATNAFGQNFNVTMTQLAASFCSLINGGNYYKPHVVKQIQDENGNVTENKDPVLLKKTISEETSEIIKDYMLGVVEEGTGASAGVEGYDIGGKTGTAEKLPRGNGKYLVSFIGYAPQENPQVVVYVVIDEPNVAEQASSSYATEMASGIMSEIFPYLGIEKMTTDDTDQVQE
ncbi:peptidoglycan D,D-transpeptidase FtsI family protein [Faecalicatena contorta]|uniref:peptidoglycan D,D-transpeptidase FtsI family protein n=1 Tax=Faecalicatena contorta TaxID=39482 RepID=UPI001F2A759B|nr:penicillin-binding protein 2 [Faecalicatena contorta]MCF2681597.1 penicillin-binding protein 2 [Faecalicatena contorta]